MVKPPKSLLEEYAAQKSKYGNNNGNSNGDGHSNDNRKRGKGSFGTNMDNTFRNYLARKIDLQRGQFGLVLPPPPPDTLNDSDNDHGNGNGNGNGNSNGNGNGNGNNDHHGDSDATKSLKKTSKSVRFNINDKNDNYYNKYGEDKRDTTKDDNRSKSNSSNNKHQNDNNSKNSNSNSHQSGKGMEGVLSRLKRKHGANRPRRHSRNKKRKKEKKVLSQITATSTTTATTTATTLVNGHSTSTSTSTTAMDERPIITNTNTNTNNTSIERNDSDEYEFKLELKSRSSSRSDDESKTKLNQKNDEDDDGDNNNNNDNEEQPLSSSLSSQSLSNTDTTTTTSQLKRQRPDLFFLGITVMVNGYTNPSSDTIMRTLHKYGGNLEKYETATVTHIIAEHLSTAKANIYKKQKKPIPVVRPKWIVDCVNACQVLPYQDYLLDEVLRRDDGCVKSFFKASTVCNVTTSTVRNVATVTTAATTTAATTAITRKENKNTLGVEDTTSKPQSNKSSSIKASMSSSTSTSLLSHSDPNKCQQKKYIRTGGPRNVGNDPNFLDSYFASSRLSFIGTFKQRMKTNVNTNSDQNVKMIKSNRKVGAECFVFHIDMDCFFAAIAVRNYPQYKNKPVAVGHGNIFSSHQFNGSGGGGDNGKSSTCELSTCNYIARKVGVKKGMFSHRARKLCPNLVILPYDYEGYEDASTKVAEILNQYADAYSGVIEQVSCDESYLELSLHKDDIIETSCSSMSMSSCTVATMMQHIGEKIRKDVFDAIECTVSVGIGRNKLLAKLATDKVKGLGGNGMHMVEETRAFLSQIKLRDLPGVGYRLEKKLEAHNLLYVTDIWTMENDNELCSILGKGNGSKIYMYCQGIDPRPVKAAERKTIGAECNYGVRFDGPYGVDYMMTGLAKEVVKRMTGIGVLGRHITIRVKERQENAPAPGKFNGHGKCNDHSKSCNLPVNSAVRDVGLFHREGMKLFADIAVDKDRVRGMGMIISKVEPENGHNQSSGREQMDIWLQKGSSETSPKAESVIGAEILDLSHSPSKDNVESPKGRNVVDLSNLPDSDLKPNSYSSINEGSGSEMDVIEIIIESPGEPNVSTIKNIERPPSRNMNMIVNEAMIIPPVLRVAFPPSIEEKQSSNNGRNKNIRYSSPKSKRKNKLKSSHVRSKIKKSDRQIDLKQMLKLVSVKSGQNKISYGGEQISLTQLGHLPLDLQLQVANDESTVTKMKADKPIVKPTLSRIRKPLFHNLNKEIINVDDDIDSENQKACCATWHTSKNNESCEQGGHFENNDIQILGDWLDKHEDPNSEDVAKLRKFICICISEMRVDEAVVFLRLVKRKSNSWTANQYKTLLTACNEQLMKSQGRKLDFSWLGL